MSPPPPPPPPPICLPSFTRRGKKKQLDEYYDEKSASNLSGSRSSRGSGSRRSRSSLPASQRPSNVGTPLARSASYSPTVTIADAQSKAEIGSRAEKLTFTEDTESYNNIPRVAPKLDRSGSKLTRGNTLRNKIGYGWGLGFGFGRKDKDKEDLFTEVDRSSSATTILPVYPRGDVPSFAPMDSRTPTRHMSQRSKSSHASKQSKDSQASRGTNLSGGSKRSNNSKRPSLTGSGSINTLVGSALERKEAHQDPIKEHVDTYARLAELRKLMAKDNLDY